MKRIVLSLVFAVAGAALPHPSGAAAQVALKTLVRHADLNLEEPRGVATLIRRIDGVVDYVCGGQPTSPTERGANEDYRACRTATIAAALREVGSPRLTNAVEERIRLQLSRR